VVLGAGDSASPFEGDTVVPGGMLKFLPRSIPGKQLVDRFIPFKQSDPASVTAPRMLKISTKRAENETTLVVEGWIIGPWVGLLRRACEEVLAGGSLLSLDLAGVMFAEQAGIAVLSELSGGQAAFLNCPAFLLTQIEGLGA
jgi:hypothetical protein